MNTQDLIKKDLLRRKILEFFKKNPKKSSVVIKMNESDTSTYWNVTKKDKKYTIKEVNISKSKFVMNEQAIKEASPAFSTVSRDFMDAMSTFDHSKLSRALKSLETNISKTKDPKEIEHLGKMSGVLTGLVDKTTGQSSLTRRTESVIREKEKEQKKPEEKPDILPRCSISFGSFVLLILVSRLFNALESLLWSKVDIASIKSLLTLAKAGDASFISCSFMTNFDLEIFTSFMVYLLSFLVTFQ